MYHAAVQIRICCIVAGTNEPSNCAMLAEYFLHGLEAALPGCQVTLLRLRDMSLEHFSLKHYDASTPKESDFLKLEEAVTHAHGLVIATPVWNFSVPAHLKNAIDRMGSFALDAERRSHGTLKNLPSYIIYTGGTPMSMWLTLIRRTVSSLPEALKYFGSAVVGRHFEPRCTMGSGKFGVVVDKRPASLKAVEAKGKGFATIIERYANDGSIPFWYTAEMAVRRLGANIIKAFF